MAGSRLLYRPSEAAESLGLSRTRVYQLISTGEIVSVKIGTSRRIAAEDLAMFVSRKREESAGVSPPRAGREVGGGCA